MKRNQAIAAIRECEEMLRKLLGAAALEGDYAAVHELAEWAKIIGGLAGKTDDSSHCETPAPPPKVSQGKPTKKLESEYPRFCRRGDDLIKVGWSKKERREYMHRSPKNVVIATAAAVRTVGASGRAFTGDSLLPVTAPADGTAYPDYQVYVALAWLKHLGFVKAIGQRGGYTLGVEKPTETAVMTAWPALKEWAGN